jgi:hypothetical protein
MSMAYATEQDLLYYLTLEATPTISVTGAKRLLQRASELIDDETFGRLQDTSWAPANQVTAIMEAAKNATCAQVEYWLEIDESLAISGYKGNIQLGTTTLQNVNYAKLAPRAASYLSRYNLTYRGMLRNVITGSEKSFDALRGI